MVKCMSHAANEGAQGGCGMDKMMLIIGPSASSCLIQRAFSQRPIIAGRVEP